MSTDATGQVLLNAAYLNQHEPELWELFRQCHWKCIQYGVEHWGWSPDKKFDPEDGYWDVNKFRTYRITSRFIRRSLIQTLLEHPRSNPRQLQVSLEPWAQLDFWYEVRNNLVHHAEGYSEDRIAEVYETREDRHKIACPYDGLLECLVAMLTEVAKVASLPEKEILLGVAESYGVYGQIREWAIDALEE